MTDEPAVVNNPRVKGHCPMGCGQTLVVTGSGHIVCFDADCPRPHAVTELLMDVETEHLVEVQEESFAVQHPLRERLDGGLFDCRLFDDILITFGQPADAMDLGRYRVIWRPRTDNHAASARWERSP